ncbi:MAG: pyridoxamine 5'-phosphate oxidase family protein [Pseudomonadota bacterium]
MRLQIDMYHRLQIPRIGAMESASGLEANMDWIEDIESLERLYDGKISEASVLKVADHITPTYRAWLEAARFVILSTVGPEGTDASPRGDEGPVVHILDDGHVALPDWRGNNRLDSLRNIVRDGRVSLMFMVPGSNTVIRLNGAGRLTADEDLRGKFARKGLLPKTVLVVQIAEIYTQCARALIRSGLWGDIPEPDLPSAGDVLREMSGGTFDGAKYDVDWPGRAAKSMW